MKGVVIYIVKNISEVLYGDPEITISRMNELKIPPIWVIVNIIIVIDKLVCILIQPLTYRCHVKANKRPIQE